MSNSNKAKNDGYKPQDRGYQPKNSGVNGGYQPPKQVTQPAPPPKKP